MSEIMNQLKAIKTFDQLDQFLGKLTASVGIMGGRYFSELEDKDFKHGRLSLNDIVKQFEKIQNNDTSHDTEKAGSKQKIIDLDKRATELLDSKIKGSKLPIKFFTNVKRLPNLFYNRTKVIPELAKTPAKSETDKPLKQSVTATRTLRYVPPRNRNMMTKLPPTSTQSSSDDTAGNTSVAKPTAQPNGGVSEVSPSVTSESTASATSSVTASTESTVTSNPTSSVTASTNSNASIASTESTVTSKPTSEAAATNSTASSAPTVTSNPTSSEVTASKSSSSTESTPSKVKPAEYKLWNREITRKNPITIKDLSNATKLENIRFINTDDKKLMQLTPDERYEVMRQKETVTGHSWHLIKDLNKEQRSEIEWKWRKEDADEDQLELGWSKFQSRIFHSRENEAIDTAVGKLDIDFQKVKKNRESSEKEDFFNPMDSQLKVSLNPVRNLINDPSQPKLENQLIKYVVRTIREQLRNLPESERAAYKLKLEFKNVDAKDASEVENIKNALREAQLDHFEII